jgi:hypothetical protein
MHDAARNGFHIRMVRECCQHKRNTLKGFVFCYDDEIDNYTPEKCYELCNSRRKNNRGKKIIQIDKDNTIVKIYDKLSDVLVDGFNMSNVSDCCNGLVDNYKGYKWIYEKDGAI